MYTWEPVVEEEAKKQNVDPQTAIDVYFTFIKEWAQSDIDDFVNAYLEMVDAAGQLQLEAREFIESTVVPAINDSYSENFERI